MSNKATNTINEDEFQAWMAKNNLAPPTEKSTSEVPEYTGKPMEPGDIDTYKGDVGSAIMNNLGSIGTGAVGAAGAYGIKKAYDLAQNFANRPVAPAAAQAVAQPVAAQAAERLVGNMPTATTATGRPLSVQTGGLSPTAPAVPVTQAPAQGGLRAALGSALGSAGRVGMSALNMAGPASMMAAPYQMAGARKEAINEDPFNKAYENNPYAMSVRSEMSGGPQITPGQAGERNRRKAAYDAAQRILDRGM